MLRSRSRLIILPIFLVAILTLFFGARRVPAQESSVSQGTLAAKLRTQRGSATDLELGGDLVGAPVGTTRYLTRDDLLLLSKVISVTANDGAFTIPSVVRGVLLEDLLRDLRGTSADMVVAICDDRYRANYPALYLADHHPILILEFNGKSPSEWAATNGYDNGPYLIAHVKFVPSFKVLAHSDEPQIPWGVVRLEFRNEKEVLGAIAPRGPHANEPAVQAGYRIAQQNCYRCHNMGAEGGQKSGLSWQVLATWASGSPDFFGAYVRNPQSKNPQAQMPRNPEYDDATIGALTAYFQTFSVPAKEKQ